MVGHFGVFVVKMGKKGRNKSRVERIGDGRRRERVGERLIKSASALQGRPERQREERVVKLTFRNVVKFGSNVSKDHDTHMVSIEISFKGVHNMHFLLSE